MREFIIGSCKKIKKGIIKTGKEGGSKKVTSGLQKVIFDYRKD